MLLLFSQTYDAMSRLLFWVLVMIFLIRYANGMRPSMQIAFVNHRAQWHCEANIPNCCADLLVYDRSSNQVWSDPPNELVLLLEVFLDPYDLNLPSHIVPTWSSINKIRNYGTPEQYLEYQTLIDGEVPGRFYFVVDEQVPFRGCVQDLIRGANVYFLVQGCIRETETCYDLSKN